MFKAKLDKDTVLEALHSVEDPEVPVSIVDLGVVKEIEVGDDRVEVELAPTYASCPGRTYITQEATRRLRDLASDVEVRWSSQPRWKSEDITPCGMMQLKDFGVGMPVRGEAGVRCPYCGSEETKLENEFGSAVCKSLFYCDACRTPFEALRGSW